jgi:hypothetical protein
MLISILALIGFGIFGMLFLSTLSLVMFFLLESRISLRIIIRWEEIIQIIKLRLNQKENTIDFNNYNLFL